MSSSEILEITTKPMVINDSSFTVQDRGITTFKPRSVVFEFDNYAPIACDLDYLFNVSERKIEYLCKNGDLSDNFPNRANYRFYDFIKNLSFMYGLKREYYKNIQGKWIDMLTLRSNTPLLYSVAPYIDDSTKITSIYSRVCDSQAFMDLAIFDQFVVNDISKLPETKYITLEKNTSDGIIHNIGRGDGTYKQTILAPKIFTNPDSIYRRKASIQSGESYGSFKYRFTNVDEGIYDNADTYHDNIGHKMDDLELRFFHTDGTTPYTKLDNLLIICNGMVMNYENKYTTINNESVLTNTIYIRDIIKFGRLQMTGLKEGTDPDDFKIITGEDNHKVVTFNIGKDFRGYSYMFDFVIYRWDGVNVSKPMAPVNLAFMIKSQSTEPMNKVYLPKELTYSSSISKKNTILLRGNTIVPQRDWRVKKNFPNVIELMSISKEFDIIYAEIYGKLKDYQNQVLDNNTSAVPKIEDFLSVGTSSVPRYVIPPDDKNPVLTGQFESIYVKLTPEEKAAGVDPAINYYIVENGVYVETENLTTFDASTDYYYHTFREYYLKDTELQYIMVNEDIPSPTQTYYILEGGIYKKAQMHNFPSELKIVTGVERELGPVDGVEYFTKVEGVYVRQYSLSSFATGVDYYKRDFTSDFYVHNYETNSRRKLTYAELVVGPIEGVSYYENETSTNPAVFPKKFLSYLDYYIRQYDMRQVSYEDLLLGPDTSLTYYVKKELGDVSNEELEVLMNEYIYQLTSNYTDENGKFNIHFFKSALAITYNQFRDVDYRIITVNSSNELNYDIELYENRLDIELDKPYTNMFRNKNWRDHDILVTNGMVHKFPIQYADVFAVIPYWFRPNDSNVLRGADMYKLQVVKRDRVDDGFYKLNYHELLSGPKRNRLTNEVIQDYYKYDENENKYKYLGFVDEFEKYYRKLTNTEKTKGPLPGMVYFVKNDDDLFVKHHFQVSVFDPEKTYYRIKNVGSFIEVTGGGTPNPSRIYFIKEDKFIPISTTLTNFLPGVTYYRWKFHDYYYVSDDDGITWDPVSHNDLLLGPKYPTTLRKYARLYNGVYYILNATSNDDFVEFGGEYVQLTPDEVTAGILSTERYFVKQNDYTEVPDITSFESGVTYYYWGMSDVYYKLSEAERAEGVMSDIDYYILVNGVYTLVTDFLLPEFEPSVDYFECIFKYDHYVKIT